LRWREEGVADDLTDAEWEPVGLLLPLRVEINLGDVVREADGDLYGDGVNIATLLADFAWTHRNLEAHEGSLPPVAPRTDEVKRVYKAHSSPGRRYAMSTEQRAAVLVYYRAGLCHHSSGASVAVIRPTGRAKSARNRPLRAVAYARRQR
jgi:hypothetical protein